MLTLVFAKPYRADLACISPLPPPASVCCMHGEMQGPIKSWQELWLLKIFRWTCGAETASTHHIYTEYSVRNSRPINSWYGFVFVLFLIFGFFGTLISTVTRFFVGSSGETWGCMWEIIVCYFVALTCWCIVDLVKLSMNWWGLVVKVNYYVYSSVLYALCSAATPDGDVTTLHTTYLTTDFSRVHSTQSDVGQTYLLPYRATTNQNYLQCNAEWMWYWPQRSTLSIA